MTNPQLELRSVTKHYDDGRVEALRGVDMIVDSGEFVTISGPSGSGKSTILHLLGGLDTPTTGTVLFQNSPLGGASDTDLYRSRHIGFIFQAFHLMPTLSALENVQVPMMAVKGANHHAERAESLLRGVGMQDRLHHFPNELSAGERQRVAIARALANSPSILLADEPTGNLDTENSARIMRILTGIQEERGMTLIVVTHENDIANSAPRHIRIRDGRIE
ncbi:ABC transporter ATP-binding protein [Telmatobacter sp. DSM 110680]|uniref:ABC transporter ATP-binding protein n=1 Tax=Telmatobacter sp. DSM 110680 TaxID=3036704 RepID=A0AAU7DG52_9BACT